VTVRQYWEGSVFVAEWTLVDANGDPVTGATVTGRVSTPDQADVAMTVTAVSNVYTGRYTVAAAGRHAWRLEATAGGEGAVEGTFIAQRSLVGLPPITVDPTTDIGRVRLLATDINEADPLLEDAQIEAFLDLESGNVKRAAALAIETIATSEALISKVLTTSDGLTTDGAKLHDSLLKRAKALRDQADEEAGDPDDYGIDIVDFDPFAAYRTGL
jgi:hypothetical protein